MSTDGQGTKRRRKIAENYNCLSRVHERYRQTTDGRATVNSESSLKIKYSDLEEHTAAARTKQRVHVYCQQCQMVQFLQYDVKSRCFFLQTAAHLVRHGRKTCVHASDADNSNFAYVAMIDSMALW